MDQQDQCPSPLSSDNVVVEMPPVTAKKPTKRPRKRPSKRFLWQEDLHLRFVAAIFDLGLKNASPKALLPLMKASDPDAGLTTEHLKSHLQKYRINYERSRREFRELFQREVKRSRKRQRRHDRHQLSAGNAYMFQSTPHDDTDSESEREEISSSASTVMEEEPQRVAPAAPTNYYMPPQQVTDVPVAAAMPELTDAQWRSFSMLMSGPPAEFNGALSIQAPRDGLLVQPQVQDELRVQMNQAMQAQMNFHRQMLTRKVELSHNVRETSDQKSWSQDNYNYDAPAPEPSSLQHVWTSSQQLHQHQVASHRQQQQTFDQYGSPQPSPAQSVKYRAMPHTLPSSSQLTITTQSEALLEAKSDAIGDDLSRWDPFNVGLENDDLFDFLKA